MTVVLADGSIVEASEKENADLFWALRGAGSNFGIVASWKLQTFEAPETLTWFSVKLNWTHETSLKGLEALEHYARNEMPSNINFRVSDYDRGSPGIEGLFYGTDAEMRKAIAPLLQTAAPLGNITESTTVNWLEAVHHYSFYDTIDWTNPSPVRQKLYISRRPCSAARKRKLTNAVQQEIFYAKSLTLKGLSGPSAKAFVDYWWTNATQLTSRNWWFQLDVGLPFRSAKELKSNPLHRCMAVKTQPSPKSPPTLPRTPTAISSTLFSSTTVFRRARTQLAGKAS
jgi:hypothetical protein